MAVDHYEPLGYEIQILGIDIERAVAVAIPVGRNAHLQLLCRGIYASGIGFTISCLKPLEVSFFSADYSINISFGVVQNPKPRASVTFSLYNVSNGQLFVPLHRSHTHGGGLQSYKIEKLDLQGEIKTKFFWGLLQAFLIERVSDARVDSRRQYVLSGCTSVA